MINTAVLDIDTIKKRIIPVAQKHGVDAVYLFGSYARGEATPESDVDLCIYAPRIRSLFKLGGFYADAEEVLGKEINLVDEEALEHARIERFRNTVKKEMLKIYDQQGT